MTKIRCIAVLVLTLVLAAALPPSAQAQTAKYTVSGTVTDTQGEPLVGVFVLVKGTKDGTATDLDGKYSISFPVSASTTLVFQYMGMENQEVKVSKSQTLNIQMKGDNTIEESVIEAGYGVVQKRSDMVGSAYQVDSEKFKTLPASRVDNLLQGMVPGLDIQESTTSAARTRYSIRVRGDASLNANSEPLWIVDGVPIYTGSQGSVNGMSYTVSPMSFINPDDIESITVLKDAATTSIYGADGANGVILVTTKQSKGDGKVRVTASMKYGISKVDRSTLIKLLNAEQWWGLARTAWTNAGYDLANFPYQDNEYNSYSTTDTDWYDVYLGTGNMREFSLRLDSGSEKAKHYLSLNYYGEDFIRKGNDQNRFTIRDRGQYKFGKRFTADLNLSFSYNVNNVVSISDSYYRNIPIFSPYDTDGVTPRMYNYYSTATDTYNPSLRKFVYSCVPEREFSDNVQRGMEFDANTTLSYQIIEGLKLSSMFGVNAINAMELIYNPKTTLDGQTSYEQDGTSRRAAAFDYTWNNIDRLNFDRKFGKHRVGALLGIEFVDTERRSFYATGSGFANDHIKEIGYAVDESRRGSSSASNSRSLSYLGTLSYSYDNRYYISASYRRQGYSSFSTYSRWGDFSSIGISWNAHNEAFFNVPFINRLKVKASYGNSGNSRVDTSAAYGTYTYGTSTYYGGLMGATQGSAPNPGLSWENTYITNLGLDLGLFNNRVDLQLEWYSKYTTNLLYKGRVSSIISDGTVMRNVGEMENRGFEISLNTTNIKTPNFKWTTDFNGSVNRNIIRKLYKGTHTGFFDYVWMEGASKDAWWLSRWAGVDPATGSPMWYDAGGDVVFAFSYENRVLLPEYNKEPDLRGGMRNIFTFGDFSLVAFMTYTIGGWELLDFGQDGYDIISYNTVVEDLDYWQQPGDVSNNPKPVYKSDSGSRRSSTRFLYNKTCFQLKNLVLTYNVPSSFCKKFMLSGATASLIGDNVYTWTPDQSRTRNSYKTMRYPAGLTRSVSAQLILNF
ncbi:MAG: SusC/RagA family TonB-linked outer membrane protein [Bacteroidales bacterium]|nr:SusC/RagA family TonB-linked outer membrane protein [Bacteroidales bacterium]